MHTTFKLLCVQEYTQNCLEVFYKIKVVNPHGQDILFQNSKDGLRTRNFNLFDLTSQFGTTTHLFHKDHNRSYVPYILMYKSFRV